MPGNQIPELTEGSEEGFSDLSLRMEGLLRGPDGRYRFEARAAHKGRPVAFAVALSTTWNAQEVEGTTVSLHWGEAQLISVGNESDGFVQALDEVYGTGLGVLQMRGNVKFLAVSLAGHPLRIEGEPIKLKLFFEHEADDRYAEVYLNCDSEESRVEFHEKDPDYRRAVVLALSQKPN
jgi:hypothetical protein